MAEVGMLVVIIVPEERDIADVDLVPAFHQLPPLLCIPLFISSFPQNREPRAESPGTCLGPRLRE
jgi:hypothetical protein